MAVHYATSDGTATAGSDYTAESGTLNFAAGQTSQTFTIPLLPQFGLVPDRTINLTLSNPTGGALLDNPRTAVVTIAGNCESVGTLDTIFGTSGTVDHRHHRHRDPSSGRPRSSPTARSWSWARRRSTAPTSEFVIARYNTDGSLDTSFGNAGIETVDFGGGTAIGHVAGAPAQRRHRGRRLDQRGQRQLSERFRPGPAPADGLRSTARSARAGA